MTKPAPVIYVDACVYLDLLTENATTHKDTGAPRWQSAKGLLDAINDDRVTLAASSLIEAEITCAAAYRDGTDEVVQQVRGWFTAPATMWTDVDRFLAREAGQLAKEWHQHRTNRERKLSGADAIHLAAAIRLGCDFLMTHNEGYPLGRTVRGVEVTRPTVVWPEHLLDGLN